MRYQTPRQNIMDKIISVKDKKFRVSICADDLQKNVKRIASEINRDYKGREIMFVSILNGAFMFAADLLKNIELDCQISFIKLSSYSGTSSTGAVKELIGLNSDISGKDVVVVEDIIETGLTIGTAIQMLRQNGAKSVKVASLIFKPDSFKSNYNVDYIGFKLPKSFIVGYGLDYDGYGRNLPEIYSIVE